MITSIILSDNSLDGQLDNEKSLKLKLVLQGIWQNGIFLDSFNSKCVKGIKDKLEYVSVKYRKEVSIFLEEMRKNPKYYFFNCLQETCPEKKCKETNFLCCLAKQCMADVVIVPTNTPVFQNVEVVTLDSYDSSNTEILRKKYLSGDPIFSKLSDSDKAIFWKRILAYTRNLNIYDVYLGTSTNNIEDFSDTLKYLTENWVKYCVHKNGLSLNITTLAKGWPAVTMRQHFIKYYLPKLPNAPITITVYRKNGVDDCFHGRYLETDSRAFRCDPGFDFYNNQTKSFKTTTFNIDEGVRSIIWDIRRLPVPCDAPRFTLTLQPKS